VTGSVRKVKKDSLDVYDKEGMKQQAAGGHRTVYRS